MNYKKLTNGFVRGRVKDSNDDEEKYFNETMEWLKTDGALREWIAQNMKTAFDDMWGVDMGNTPNRNQYVKELFDYCMNNIHIDGE